MNLPLHRTTTLIGAAALTLMAGLASPDTARAAGVLGQGTWTDTLLARDLDQDGGTDAYYDMVLNITWLRAANTTLMSWQQATDWAGGLNFGGYTDWRLPTMVDTGAAGVQCTYSGTDCGYNVDTSTSEMAHLFHVTLGNLSAFDTSGVFRGGSSGVNWGLVNTAPFVNMQSYVYWSGLEYLSPTSGVAWNFVTNYGYQDALDEVSEFYAVAVRPGDVAAAVPEPQALALVLLALGAAGVARRQRPR